MTVHVRPHEIAAIRAYEPARIWAAVEARRTRELPQAREKILVLACDHPARGALAAGGSDWAMASRLDVLDRCARILAHPQVAGFLGTADMVEDLTLMGALENKLVWGSMNRGGIHGARFEMDDRFTGYTAEGLGVAGLTGGKMLLRIDLEDPGSARTLESCARAIDQLSDRGLNAMVEPFMSRRVDGAIENDLTAEGAIRAVAIAAGLGKTSQHTWLKLPCVPHMDRVVEASTLPALILGGGAQIDPQSTLRAWADALNLPGVIGLVIGRALMFPLGGDVEANVERLVAML